MTHTVALIGAGAMGGTIGARLLDCDCALRAFDIDPARCAPLAERGAVLAPSAAAAVEGAHSVVLSLNTADVVERAVFAEAGVAEGLALGAGAGGLIIDMSSIAPDATARLAERAAGQGLQWVDSPLSGGIPKARTGELTLMLGGDLAAVERARETLQHLGSNITHMGPAGAGQATKLINQVLCAIGFAAVAEATRLAEDAGIDVQRIPAALAGGRADSALLQEYLPRFAERDFRPTGRIDNMVKDLDGALALGRAAGSVLPLTSQVAELHRLMVRAGAGDGDQARLIAYYDGLPPPPTVALSRSDAAAAENP